MTELFVDFSSPAALAKSYDAQARELRAMADDAESADDRDSYLEQAKDAEDLAAEVRREYSVA